MFTSGETIALLFILIVFVAAYLTSLRTPVEYVVKCAAYFALLVYLVKQMF
jgi:hypothetical protein